MPRFCISNKNKYILSLPFLYTYFSRSRRPRDFLVNVITSWVPGIILVAFQADIFVMQAIAYFFVGYILFTCIYEVGYLANDSYGLMNDSTPRQRLNINYNSGFVFTFVLLRLVSFLGIAAWVDVITVPIFWSSYAALAIVLVMHNTIRRVEFKFLSFLQLSLLRFSLPVFLVLLIFERPGEVMVTFLTGLMLFSYTRLITYMDAKDRLSIPERKEVTFLLLCLLTALPFLFLVSLVAHTWAPIVVWLWLLIAQMIYVFVNRVKTLDRVKKLFDPGDG